MLPAASYLETDDLYRAYGAYWMQWGQQAAKPQGEARSNFDVAQALARRMGLTDAIFTLSPQDAARELFKGATGPAAAADPAKLFAGEPIHIAHDWDGQPFKTPSGKLEFYSEQLARLGVSPMPDWNEDPVEVAEAAKWPLRLLTAPGYFQAHTAFSGVGFLRGREGKPFCVLHPEDAAKRGLKRRRRGAAVQRPRRDRPDAAGERRDPARRRAGARPAADRRGGVAAPSTCCARTATPTWAKARPTRAPGSMSGRGRKRPDLNSLPRHTGEVARRAGGGEPQIRSRLIPDLKFSRLSVGLSPSAPFGGTSPV